ncbi:MAG: hypothetical protein ABSD56_03795 [Bryobacteraceae bacterium]
MSAPSPAGDYAELRTVDVNGPGFTQAFPLTTKRLSANAWDIRIRCFQTLAARLGDTIVARFWMRTTSPQAADGHTTSEGRTHPPGIDGKLPAYPNNPRPVAAAAIETQRGVE